MIKGLWNWIKSTFSPKQQEETPKKPGVYVKVVKGVQPIQPLNFDDWEWVKSEMTENEQGLPVLRIYTETPLISLSGYGGWGVSPLKPVSMYRKSRSQSRNWKKWRKRK